MIKSQNNENQNEGEGESLLDSLYKMTKESTQNECNIKLLQKVVELNNKIFYHQVEEHCLNERINGLISQIQFRDQNQRIITLQLNIQQSDANTYKQKVTMLEKIIESMRQHKKLIIKEFQQSQKKLRASIAEKQRDYTTTIQIKEVQTKQREGQIKATLEGISKQLKQEKQKNLTLIRNNDQSLKSFQVYYKLYEELKNMLILTLSQNKDQKNPDFAFLSQLVSNICFKVQELEFEKKKIQQFVTIQEGNNSYREQNLFNRVKTNFKNYEEKALRKQKNLENVQIFLNNLLKQEGFQNDFSYGQALLQKLKDKFIDYKAKLQQLKKNIQVFTQKQKIKEEEIKKIKETALKYKQQYQRIKKQQTKVLQELEKQKKVGENYKRSYQQLNSQLEVNITSSKLKMSQITQNFQSQSSKKEQIILNLNKKIRDIEQKKQNELSNERKKIEKLEEKLKQFQNEINAEIERFDQAQKKHQKQIEQIQKSNKNGEQRINKIKEDCELQKRKIKSQLDEFKKKYLDLEDNNKNITKMIDEVKNNLEIKSLQIKQIQQQLCAIVNQARLDRNQSTKNAQTYKQALYALNKLLKDSGAKTGSALFKIPSLSEKYQGNIQWVKGIIDQYCGCGTKFESKFIGKIDEYFRDFSKILNNQNLIPNLLLIIQTSKGVSFCIFITKFTTNIKDKDPVVFFSAEKKLKYPNEKKINTDARPSMINPQGAIQFGKKQLTISKMLEMKLNIVPTGYFGNLDIQSMYGIQTVAETLTIQKMQIHQIVF